jgi:hypothetical protein
MAREAGNERQSIVRQARHEENRDDRRMRHHDRRQDHMRRPIARIGFNRKAGPEGNQDRHRVEHQRIERCRIKCVLREDDRAQQEGHHSRRHERAQEIEPLPRNEPPLGSKCGRRGMEHRGRLMLDKELLEAYSG